MTYAIGRLTTEDGILLGTAFAISSSLALTAFHCVGDRQSNIIEHSEVLLHFKSCVIAARVQGGGVAADSALLVLSHALPPSERPVSLGSECWPHERWYSIGFPASATPTDRGWTGGFALTGWVAEPDSGYLPVPTIQLHCDQSAASQPLRLEGLSGPHRTPSARSRSRQVEPYCRPIHRRRRGRSRLRRPHQRSRCSIPRPRSFRVARSRAVP